MVRHLAACLAAAALCFVAACSADGESSSPQPAQWQSFTDETTGLGFELPGEPETITQRVQLPDGRASQIIMHMVEVGEERLVFSVFPVGDEQFSLEGAVEGAAEAIGGQVETWVSVRSGGHDGRDAEISYEDAGGASLMLLRVLSVDGVVVQLQSTGPAVARAEVEGLHELLLAGFDG